MLDVRRLRVLQELDRHGTVSAAAAALHLTPSAVSQQLAALAREVGCPVVGRDGRNVRLTSAARVLLDHAGELFAQLELLDADLQRHQSGEVGVVRVGGFQTASSAIIVPAAADLVRSQPRLELHLVQMDAPRSFLEVAAGRLDIAVSVEYVNSPPSGDPRFARIPLLRDEFRALLPADHPLAARDEVALADLRHDAWIGNLPGSPCHFVTMAACAAAGFSPRVRHAIDDWAIIVELVAAGLGVGLIPTLAHPPARPDIAIRPLANRAAARNIFAVTRRGTEEAPTVAVVLAAMAEAAGRRAAMVAEPATKVAQPARAAALR
ncbi:MAG TPA: LysR family transcriptional regulator [Acidimicrobiales bacterium]